MRSSRFAACEGVAFANAKLSAQKLVTEWAEQAHSYVSVFPCAPAQGEIHDVKTHNTAHED